MTLLLLMVLLLARANGLVVPEVCWIVFGIQFILSLLVGIAKIDRE